MTGFSPELLVSSQLPRNVANDNPLLVKFFEYYYEFQENARIQEIIQEFRKFVDMDQTDIAFLETLFEEFKQVPRVIATDKRLLAKHIFDIYKSKGSEKSLLLMFKILFGEDVTVRYPSENILRASVGNWVKDTVLNVSVTSGNLTTSTNYIGLYDVYGEVRFPIEMIEVVPGTSRIVFIVHLPSAFVISDFTTANFYSNDTLDGTGTIDDIVAGLNILDGGSGWKVGQLVVFAGITGTQQNPEINSDVQVAQFSDPALNGQIAYVYGGDYDGELALFSGTFKDTIAQVKEVSATGAITRLDIVQYGFGNSTTVYIVAPQKPVGNETDATIELVFGKQVAGLGYFTSLDGMLSVPDICLEDNFFYQLFSYVIETNHLLSEFEGSLKLIHPAGSKYFVNSKKETDIDVIHTVYRELTV